MNKAEALRVARELLGPAAVARDGGAKSATTYEQRPAARAEIAILKSAKPPHFGTRLREIECIPFRQRYAIGKDVGYALRVYGTGDTWDEAIAVAQRVTAF